MPDTSACTWTTRDGRSLPVSEMSTMHIMNAMRVTTQAVAQALFVACAELTDHGTVLIQGEEMDSVQFLSFVAMTAEELHPPYGALRRELASRMKSRALPSALLSLAPG